MRELKMLCVVVNALGPRDLVYERLRRNEGSKYKGTRYQQNYSSAGPGKDLKLDCYCFFFSKRGYLFIIFLK